MNALTSRRLWIPSVLLIGVLGSCEESAPVLEAAHADSGGTREERAIVLGEEEIVARLKRGLEGQDVEKFDLAKTQVASLTDEALTRLVAKYALSFDDSRARRIYEVLVEELAKRDPEAALALYADAEGKDFKIGFNEVATVIAENNPGQLGDWLLGKGMEGDMKNRRRFIFDGIRAFARTQGREYALKFSDLAELGPLEKDELPMLIFYGRGDLVPEEAIRLARQYLTGNPLQMSIDYIGQSVFATDKILGLKIGGELESQSHRDRFFAYQYRSWLQEDPEGAFLHLEKVDPKKLERIIRTDTGHFFSSKGNVIEILAKLNPEFLVKTLGAMAVTSSNESAFQVGVVNLSKEHPQRALTLIEGMPESELKANLYSLHFDQRLSKNIGLALSGFAELPAGDIRNAAYEAAGLHLGMEKGYDATMSQLRELPEADQAGFLRGAIPQLVGEDPQNVVELLNNPNAPISGETRMIALSNVGRILSRNDPESAQKWLSELEGSDRAPAMEAMARVMIKSDVEGLVETLSEVPKDEGWAAGVRVLIDDLKSSDPQTSQTWTELLEKSGF